ncbi:phosphoribosylamine--glycine ligase [Sedimentibacter acidaminivorans]|uniref:Phosphoribosylamine--glycine ligase n=1 Tax=Sedimentibacter acidaminivorans TaxID=913099 RepID=A0ABS4GHF2_9FIRM|nr:phosphoribosylamine--glycine ligase [Sedimentibacter acidaminivorans]MBP1927128.1 phosphoribosylamine--glycine ligase [Sedimentibacter acidaminivorans]
MKILVVGGGAREHTICWKLNQSNMVTKIYCAPGNAGISQIAKCVDIKAEDIEKITDFSVDNNIDMVVVGPEGPLVDGLVDILMEKGIKAFGPSKKGARLEGSKSYSKDFMKKYNIPTAKYETYIDSKKALEGLHNFTTPIVIKADGLAAGKGVLICETINEAKDAINSIMRDKQFGEAGNTVVIEEFLNGIETSLLCFVNGKDIIPMESARDYKKAYDNDKGLNTGGMGCFSPNPIYTESLKKYIKENILDTTLNGFIEENMDFKGILFIGLMITGDEAKVLEYNTRFGDPETEVVLPRLKSDLCKVMEKTIDGTLTLKDLQWTEMHSTTVVLASGGYPDNYEKGKEITGLDLVDEDVIVFHGGTKLSEGKILTDGGRVLAVTALGDTIEEARNKVYKNIEKIKFDKMEYRKDIAKL